VDSGLQDKASVAITSSRCGGPVALLGGGSGNGVEASKRERESECASTTITTTSTVAIAAAAAAVVGMDGSGRTTTTTRLKPKFRGNKRPPPRCHSAGFDRKPRRDFARSRDCVDARVRQRPSDARGVVRDTRAPDDEKSLIEPMARRGDSAAPPAPIFEDLERLGYL
jgi:hypothetical protein